MESGAVLPAVLNGGDQHRVLEELAVPDGLGDAGQLLIDDAAGAEIGVSDLAVAHLPLRQADGQAGAAQQGVRTAGEQRVERRRARRGDGVVGRGRSLAPAVEDRQQQRLFH